MLGEVMYKIVICDDEKEIAKEIEKKIESYFNQQDLLAEYVCVNDARQLMEMLEREFIDVLFLDIDMPYFTGMDIAAYINEKGLGTILVFVTSHDALVYQTFAYRPFGFMRKTYMDQEFPELTERIGRELGNKKQEIVITKGQELLRIPIKDIIYVESEGNYLNIVKKDEVIKYRETMTNMEKELIDKGFIRCHKGYLIQGEYIVRLKCAEVELSCGTETSYWIPVGRSYEKEVKRKILESIRNS